jgi:hypothetical protein
MKIKTDGVVFPPSQKHFPHPKHTAIFEQKLTYKK